jgi:hypothetical protein
MLPNQPWRAPPKATPCSRGTSETGLSPVKAASLTTLMPSHIKHPTVDMIHEFWHIVKTLTCVGMQQDTNRRRRVWVMRPSGDPGEPEPAFDASGTYMNSECAVCISLLCPEPAASTTT